MYLCWVVPYDGLNWNNDKSINPGYSLVDIDLGEEDYDLGIQIGEATEFSIIGDRKDTASNVCRFIFGRSDRPVKFRFAPDLSCTTIGLQEVPDGAEYNGLETLDDSWILDIGQWIAN